MDIFHFDAPSHHTVELPNGERYHGGQFFKADGISVETIAGWVYSGIRKVEGEFTGEIAAPATVPSASEPAEEPVQEFATPTVPPTANVGSVSSPAVPASAEDDNDDKAEANS